MRCRGVLHFLLCPSGVCARPSRNNMAAQLGYGSYPASNRSVPAREDSLHGDDSRLCLSGSSAGDRGVYAVRYEFVTAGASAYPGRTPRQTAPGDDMIVWIITEKLTTPSTKRIIERR